MNIEISLRNQQKLQYLVELLRSLDFVESVTVRPDAADSDTTLGEESLFDQFYGKAHTGATIEQVNQQVDSLRNEWTRNF